MWNLRKRIDLACVPAARTVVRFAFTDRAKPKRWRWIVGDRIGDRTGMTLRITDPGCDANAGR